MLVAGALGGAGRSSQPPTIEAMPPSPSKPSGWGFLVLAVDFFCGIFCL